MFPGFNTAEGFYGAVAIMVATALGMIWYFRSRRWL